MLQKLPQLSVPVVVVSQAGMGAEQEPLETQPLLQAEPVLLQGFVQLSVPVVVVPQAGMGAEQEPLETQLQAAVLQA